MTFYADLHVHSKFARATSGDSDLEHMALWASKKGIAVIGTGDFTHPGWFKEIKEKLVPAEPGLFRLRDDLQQTLAPYLPASCAQPTRFMLEVEISTIYKKGDQTRKIHHLIYVPDLETAERLIECLSRIGNLTADGRPILGLDSRDLLEITLASGESAYLVPAHIWTPWFAVLGSKSGFDRLEDCYGDLTPHIFALETGLSSDPSMNRRLSSLDRYQLVSNSDAHSPSKLGREACVFNTEKNYFAIRRALKTGDGYEGTVEFFPEEGKYHADGHRKCDISLDPEQTRHHQGRCPVCGKPLTLGVLHRVTELADRSIPRKDDIPFRSFIPLTEVLSEIEGVGPATKKVQQSYEHLVTELGSELFILEQAPLDRIQSVGSSLLAEAISRMRKGDVICKAGYDGQYGSIRLFSEKERLQGTSVALLFDLPPVPSPEPSSQKTERIQKIQKSLLSQKVSYREKVVAPQPFHGTSSSLQGGILEDLDPEQRAAVQITQDPLLIIAGPGTGKTRTLTHRIAYLIADCGISSQQCLAITFTQRAAGEMRDRLQRLIPGKTVPVMTFHAFGYTLLKEHGKRIGLKDPLQIASRQQQRALLQAECGVAEQKAQQLLKQIANWKRRDPALMDDATPPQGFEAYTNALRDQGLIDFEDLIALSLQLLTADKTLIAHYQSRYRWMSVDEYQDIDPLQYQLLTLLVSEEGNLCAIGDPDQAIYSFRGTDVRFFQQFPQDFPKARIVRLIRNYRSGKTIVTAASQVIAPATLVPERQVIPIDQDTTKIKIYSAATDKAEAEFVVHAIERMMGGSTFFSMDSGRVDSTAETEGFSFADFAVLYRTDVQSECLCEAFHRSGIPFQKHTHLPLLEQPHLQALLHALRQQPTDLSLVERLHQSVTTLDLKMAERLAGPLAAVLQPLAKRCGGCIETFEAELALSVDTDLWDLRAECVSLFTLHAAKGLEFKVTFIVGCEDDILPLHPSAKKDSDDSEERRLFFVGLTRARRHLVLSHAHKRFWRGKLRPMTPSPFLRAIETQLLEQSKGLTKPPKQAQSEQLELF